MGEDVGEGVEDTAHFLEGMRSGSFFCMVFVLSGRERFCEDLYISDVGG